LTNLETANEKLLQILLVGQPELDQKLDSVDLRQLKQRVALRSHLSALDLNEAKGYIERRLQLAGSPAPSTLFPPEAIAAIHRHSRGIPRLINTICENGLIAAYAKNSTTVTSEMIDAIAKDFRLGVHTRKEKSPVPDEVDLQDIAKKLLSLYSHVANETAREDDLNARMPVRVIKQ
jgi:general secretion pathway protein A